MKSVSQSLQSGDISILESPRPGIGEHSLLIRTTRSLISAGTERMLLDFGRAGWIEKAKSQPDKVKQVLSKARTDGVAATIDAVRAKLAAPISPGYCNAGVVVQTGSNVMGFAPGDRVVSNGPHAEYVAVAETLVARIPDGVSDDAAAFTPLAAIALAGIRLAAPTLGETIVVYGLGLVGQLAVQLLRASGCHVIGIDRDPVRLALAARHGAASVHADDLESVVHRVRERTGGVGADAVLLTLASDSDDPVHAAAEMSRQRGRLVLVGVTGLSLRRDDFYKKELSFQVSASYGPGRYDADYESGRDYPVGLVRWTARRNFEAVLWQLASGAIDPGALVSHRFPLERARDAYDIVGGKEPSLGIVLEYAGATEEKRATPALRTDAAASDTFAVSAIGAGEFGSRVLLPALVDAGATLRVIASKGGVSAGRAMSRFGFVRASANYEDALSDTETTAIVILTRHDSHAALAAKALQAGKHVFVEKPLAMSHDQLDQVERAARESRAILAVGFNRRWAPLTTELQQAMHGRAGPANIIITVNAGALPPDHWTRDPEAGGGRIVGEACHFIDLARCLVAAPIRAVSVSTTRDSTGAVVEDNACIALDFTDGSLATIHYLTNGARQFPKERVECFWDGRVGRIDNWKSMQGFGWSASRTNPFAAQDKGHRVQIEAFARGVRAGIAPVALDEVFEVSRWTIVAADLARRGGGRSAV